MKKLKLVLFFAILIIGLSTAFATKHKMQKKSTYTIYYCMATNASGTTYHWTTTAPVIPTYICVYTGQNTTCDTYVDDSFNYTPQDDTPIPQEYTAEPFGSYGQDAYFLR